MLLLDVWKGMRRERKVVFEIEGQGKVRVKGYKQGFLKIVFRKSFQSNGHAKVSSYSPSIAPIPPVPWVIIIGWALVEYYHSHQFPGLVISYQISKIHLTRLSQL